MVVGVEVGLVGAEVGEVDGASVGAGEGAAVIISPPMNSVRWVVLHVRSVLVEEIVVTPSVAQSPAVVSQ